MSVGALLRTKPNGAVIVDVAAKVGDAARLLIDHGIGGLPAVDDPIRRVMERMTRDRLRQLVVMGADRIAGVISVGDIVKHRLDELETEAGVLRDYVAA